MQLTQGAIDFLNTQQPIPLIVQIEKFKENERFESFILQKCNVYDGLKFQDIYLISKKSINQQIVQDQKPIIQIEEFKTENGFIVVGKYKEIQHISYLEESMGYEEEFQDFNQQKLSQFSEFVKDNYYNIKAIVQSKAEKKDKTDTLYQILTLSDSQSSLSATCLIFISEVELEAYQQFKNQLEEGLEFYFQNVRIDTYKNENRIYFSSKTRIQIAPSSILWIKFNDIKFHMIGKDCNLIGYIYQIKQLKQVSANVQLKKIYIFDMDFNKVKIVVWNQLAKTLKLSENQIVGFLNLVIKEYQNKIHLSLNYKTRILTNSKSLIQIKNFDEFQNKCLKQYEQIDKRSYFYKMGFQDIKMVVDEFQQISDLQFINSYRIKAKILEFQEIDLISAINKLHQFKIIISDESNIKLSVNVNGSKFTNKIFNLNEEKHIGQPEFQFKFNKNDFQEAKNRKYDFIIIGQNVEENNEIRTIFKLVKIISDIQIGTSIEVIQKAIKLNEECNNKEKLISEYNDFS